MPAPAVSSVGASNYAFYDENYRPMWKRGISRKLGESAFVQQRLPTIRPSWSIHKVCPTFLLMGAFFIGMGIAIKIFSDNIKEITIPYTNCESEEYPGQKCSDVIKTTREDKDGVSRFTDAIDLKNCTCHVQFRLAEPLNGTVYIYYALADFYQNHKQYYLSRDENQLKGKIFESDNETARNPSGECKPFDGIEETDEEMKKRRKYKKIIYPCGLMANSMFNDEISLVYYSNDSISYPYHVPLRNTGIAWESDREDKYKLPPQFFNTKHPKWLQFTKPMKWKKSIWELDPHNATNNGVLNEDFLVWMRAGAFPWFRKMYRIVDPGEPPFDKGLPKGDYALRIKYNYDVESYGGEKSIILSTTHIVAGKNMFLAIAYWGTGGLLVFLSVFLFLMHKLFAPSLEAMETSLKKES